MKPNKLLLFVALSVLLYGSGAMAVFLYMLHDLMQAYLQSTLKMEEFNILL